jgi:diaminopimelate decarboxylase
VDGGLSDNPRPALYEAEYTAVIANKANQPATMAARVAGAHCETDTLIPDTTLQPVEEGDIMAVFCTGAYNFAMASNYNRFRRPAMVLVSDGQADIIYKRETLEDLVSHDVIPARLSGEGE